MRRGTGARIRLPLRFYVAVLVGLSLGTAVVGAAVAGAEAKSDVRRSALDAASYAAGQASTRVADDIALIRQTAATTATTPGLSQAFSQPGCTLTFAGAGSFTSGHLDIVRPDGSIACSSAPASVSTRPVYDHESWSSPPFEQPVLVAPAIDATTGAQALIEAEPIPGGGMVVVVADLDTVGPSLSSLYGGPEGLEFVITTPDGHTAVSRSIDPSRWTGTTVDGTSFRPLVGNDGSDLDGTKRLYAEKTVEGVGWDLYAGADLGRALASADRLYHRQLVILLGGLAMLLVVALVVYRQIARPIRKLKDDVRAAATRPDPTVMSVNGPVEIASLAGEINGLLAAVDRDVTERNKAANRELEAFSYSVSHDLRSPLRAIDGFARILVEEHAAALGTEGRRYLERVMANTRLMGQLIDDLLEFSRLGRSALHKEAIEPAVLIDEALGFLADEREGRDVEVVVHELPPCFADPRLMRLVFVNLLSNALKYTRDRTRTRVEIGAIDHDGIPAYYVKDNGAGFDMRYAGKLFGVFQRLHSAEQYEGTGVGRATVHRIIERHGGRIWAEAQPGQGATFSFTVRGVGTEGTRWRGELGSLGDPLVMSN